MAFLTPADGRHELVALKGVEAVVLRGRGVIAAKAVLRDRGRQGLVVGVHRVVLRATGNIAVRRHRQADEILLVHMPCRDENSLARTRTQSC